MDYFKAEHIDHFNTGLLSPLIRDYLSGAMDGYVNFPFSLQGLSEAVQYRKDFNGRALLVERLSAQNSNITLSDPSMKNLEALRASTTFTVTTGHQLCLFTGPLYFIHKILSTIKHCTFLKETHPNMDFVPVFWMASEDHDLEEVDHFHAFNRTFKWRMDQGGAVGRMVLDGMGAILDEVEALLGKGDHAMHLMAQLREAYADGVDLATATRKFVNALLGEYGLLIIDGDDPELKRSFAPFMEKEIQERRSFDLINGTIEAEEWKYKAQVHPRRINLFYLAEGGRERLEVLDDGMIKIGAEERTIEEVLAELKEHPGRFSPNVVMRPMYQEFVLPNIAYVGGAGELAYWLEFKTAFEEFGLKMPVLVLRDHALWINKRTVKRMLKLDLGPEDLFMDRDELITKKAVVDREEEVYLDNEAQELEELFKRITKRAADLEPTLERSAGAEEARLEKGISRLQKKMFRAARRQAGEKVDRIDAIRDQVFPNGTLQERRVNFMELYAEHGHQMFDVALNNMDALEKRFLILSEVRDQ